jgi:hypothetical protein
MQVNVTYISGRRCGIEADSGSPLSGLHIATKNDVRAIEIYEYGKKRG